MITTKSSETMNVQVDMPAPKEGPYDNNAGWWAVYFLELGQTAQYTLLLHYLDLAQKNGCLRSIRQAAEEIVKAQKRASKPSIRKVKRRSSGTFKAVAA